MNPSSTTHTSLSSFISFLDLCVSAGRISLMQHVHLLMIMHTITFKPLFIHFTPRFHSAPSLINYNPMNVAFQCSFSCFFFHLVNQGLGSGGSNDNYDKWFVPTHAAPRGRPLWCPSLSCLACYVLLSLHSHKDTAYCSNNATTTLNGLAFYFIFFTSNWYFTVDWIVLGSSRLI